MQQLTATQIHDCYYKEVPLTHHPGQEMELGHAPQKTLYGLSLSSAPVSKRDSFQDFLKHYFYALPHGFIACVHLQNSLVSLVYFFKQYVSLHLYILPPSFFCLYNLSVENLARLTYKVSRNLCAAECMHMM